MKKVELFEQYIAEKKTKEDYKDIIDDLESKIWEIENTKASWIPDSPAKKDKMIQTYQKKIDAAKKTLSKLDESAINEARAPKTKDELISALDDAYFKLDKYNTKYYEISRAPGGGSWSSSSKEGKAALKYKKMAGNQQANIWKWTDKLRKLGFEYNTNEAVVTEGQADVNKSYDKVIELIRKEARRLNDDDAYEFHERLKEFFNKTI
jgi:hypothetical protein